MKLTQTVEKEDNGWMLDKRQFEVFEKYSEPRVVDLEDKSTLTELAMLGMIRFGCRRDPKKILVETAGPTYTNQMLDIYKRELQERGMAKFKSIPH